MKFNNSGGTSEEQSGEEQSSEPEQQQAVQPPQAASKRDVREAERKAEEAKAKAVEEAERVDTALRSEVEELRELVAKLDQAVNALYKKGATRKGEPPLNDGMPYVVPENRDEEEEDHRTVEFVRGEDGE